jgi:hypothetical protein
MCIEKCKNSYRKSVEIVSEMNLKGVNLRDVKQVRDFISGY